MSFGTFLDELSKLDVTIDEWNRFVAAYYASFKREALELV